FALQVRRDLEVERHAEGRLVGEGRSLGGLAADLDVLGRDLERLRVRLNLHVVTLFEGPRHLDGFVRTETLQRRGEVADAGAERGPGRGEVRTERRPDDRARLLGELDLLDVQLVGQEV